MPTDDASRNPAVYAGIAEQLRRYGLSLRGGFHPEAGEAVPGDNVSGQPRTLLLVGVVGGGIWPAFEPFSTDGDNPLDTWTKRIVDAVAADAGAIPVYPNDKPFWPFQQWAKRSEPVFQSPLGLLIHPEFGLWHAYRAALVFSEIIELPARGEGLSPCESCTDKPCLSACPAGAFSPSGYDVPKCAEHLRSQDAEMCLSGGCRARDACPFGANYRYSEPQIRFHMAAFNRTVNGA